MLSKYTITSLMQIKSPSISFIILWKVTGALENPKYITVASKRPRLVINTVFHSSPSLMQTLLYPHVKNVRSGSGVTRNGVELLWDGRNLTTK